MLGYTADEILGAHVSRFHTEESNDRDWPQYLLDRADAEGWDEDIGWRMRRDGSLFWADVVITALRNEIGGLRGFDKVTRDASSWRQAEETQRRYAEYQASIIQVQADIARSELDTDKLMRLVVDRVQALTNASGALVELLEGDDTLRVAAASGTVSAYRGAQLSLYDSLSGLCIRTERVLGSDDTETDSRVNPGSRQARVRSAVVAPLQDEGRAIGVLKVISNQPHAFDEQHRGTLQLLAGFLGATLGHAQARAERTHAEKGAQAAAGRFGSVLRAATECSILGIDLNGTIPHAGRVRVDRVARASNADERCDGHDGAPA